MPLTFGPSHEERPVRIPIDHGQVLTGDLGVPPGATGLVLFAHGSGSSRLSPRNRYVAQVLRNAGLATLLFDLFTPPEEALDDVTGELRFNLPFLAQRLVMAIDWVETQPDTAALPIGLFGASTGGGAAIMAAAERPGRVQAVVSRGGRPDLAGDALGRSRAATLLIVGGADPVVLTLNEQAYDVLQGLKVLRVVPGATHLFEEPGALDAVAGLAADWFSQHLKARAASDLR